MAEYRWNQSDLAAGYDKAAEHVHPHYLELQGTILDLLPFAPDAAVLLVDLGGGSGRLAERFLNRFPNARAVVVDDEIYRSSGSRQSLLTGFLAAARPRRLRSGGLGFRVDADRR